MSIEVKIDRDGWTPWTAERCCFCRAPTRTWVVMEDMRKSVACCEDCAARADIKDVPTKAQWFRREHIATGAR